MSGNMQTMKLLSNSKRVYGIFSLFWSVCVCVCVCVYIYIYICVCVCMCFFSNAAPYFHTHLRFVKVFLNHLVYSDMLVIVMNRLKTILMK